MRSILSAIAVPLLIILSPPACTQPETAAPKSVGAEWERSADSARRTPPGGARHPGSDGDAPIATVDGRPIPRHRLVSLLLSSHGVGALEQLIVLDAAERLAADRGIGITQPDVDYEYEQALRQLVDPVGSVDTGPFDRAAAERTLDAVLSDRNISREEFMLGMRRHAYLRKLVMADLRPTEEQLQAEFKRLYGPRLQVRHIQLASPREVARVRSSLAAGGSFADLAKAHSANLVSAEAGGLLEPFSPDDEALPELFRTTAAALKPGEVSEAVRIGEWYHLIKLERCVDAQDADFEAVRPELVRSLCDRLAPPAMQRLYERLFREARIEIHDPVLKEAFDRVHPSRKGRP